MIDRRSPGVRHGAAHRNALAAESTAVVIALCDLLQGVWLVLHTTLSRFAPSARGPPDVPHSDFLADGASEMGATARHRYPAKRLPAVLAGTIYRALGSVVLRSPSCARPRAEAFLAHRSPELPSTAGAVDRSSWCWPCAVLAESSMRDVQQKRFAARVARPAAEIPPPNLQAATTTTRSLSSEGSPEPGTADLAARSQGCLVGFCADPQPRLAPGSASAPTPPGKPPELRPADLTSHLGPGERSLVSATTTPTLTCRQASRPAAPQQLPAPRAGRVGLLRHVDHLPGIRKAHAGRRGPLFPR